MGPGETTKWPFTLILSHEESGKKQRRIPPDKRRVLAGAKTHRTITFS